MNFIRPELVLFTTIREIGFARWRFTTNQKPFQLVLCNPL